MRKPAEKKVIKQKASITK